VFPVKYELETPVFAIIIIIIIDVNLQIGINNNTHSEDKGFLVNVEFWTHDDRYFRPKLAVKSRLTMNMAWNVFSPHNVHERFEVFVAVTLKNGIFCYVTPRGSCKNRRFGGT
jgi:hypothetical protein